MGVSDLPLPPKAAADACVLATLCRMLKTKEPYTLDLFHEGRGWFAMAKAIFRDRGFMVEGSSIFTPQGSVVSDVPQRLLAMLAAASRKARNADALSRGVLPPDINVISMLRVADGQRPHLGNQLVATAAALRCNDQQALREVARADVCPLCSTEIGPHHPMRCSAVSARGMAHDKLVNVLARHVAKNLTISVRANKGLFKPSTRQVDPTFRPDIAIEETNQLFEVKTANADAGGPAISAKLARYAREAHVKYIRKLQRDPLVIATTTDGFVSKEGHRALDALNDSAYQDMPVKGPRLTLIAGFALCEAAAGAYDAWHWSVRSVQPLTGAGGA